MPLLAVPQTAPRTDFVGLALMRGFARPLAASGMMVPELTYTEGIEAMRVRTSITMAAGAAPHQPLTIQISGRANRALLFHVFYCRTGRHTKSRRAFRSSDLFVRG